MTQDETCSTCLFFCASPEGKFGWCKYNPPVLIGSRELDGKLIGVFNNPTVSANSYCAMWEGE